MSNDKNKHRITRVFVIVSCASICAILIGWNLIDLPLPHRPASPEEKTYTESKRSTTEQYTVDRLGDKESIDNSQPSHEQTKTFNQLREITTVSQRGNPDLAAQEGMWVAANYLVKLTFVQMILGFATVVLVGFTFYVQRRELGAANRAANAAEIALEETQRANFAQLKPYIRIPDAKFAFTPTDENKLTKDTARVKLIVSFENIGKTPVKNLSNIEFAPAIKGLSPIMTLGHRRQTKIIHHLIGQTESVMGTNREELGYEIGPSGKDVITITKFVKFTFSPSQHSCPDLTKYKNNRGMMEVDYWVGFNFECVIKFDDIETIATGAGRRECRFIVTRNHLGYGTEADSLKPEDRRKTSFRVTSTT